MHIPNRSLDFVSKAIQAEFMYFKEYLQDGSREL
jgi:hypothetical protein